jgi:hypothetical protein
MLKLFKSKKCLNFKKFKLEKVQILKKFKKLTTTPENRRKTHEPMKTNRNRETNKEKLKPQLALMGLAYHLFTLGGSFGGTICRLGRHGRGAAHPSGGC